MTETSLLPLLKAWPGKWRHAELWRIACESEPPDANVILQSLLESISRPLEPLEVYRRLLNEGSFSAAEALLEHPPLADTIDDALVADPGSDLDLDHRRLQARGQFLGALDVLLIRNRRAGSLIAADDSRLQQALEWSSRDKRYADRLLDDLEKSVLYAELERVDILRVRLAERLAHFSDVPPSWRDAVERSLDQRQLDIAEALISGPHSHRVDDAHIPLPRPLENARFANVPAPQLCRWILGKERGPSDFYERWDILSIDASNRALIETLERLCVSHPTEDDVTRLVVELQARLNVKESPSPVERFDNAYRTTLRGLEDEACPAFTDSAVSIFVTRDGVISDDATRGIRLAIVFHPGGKLQPSDYAQLTPWDIVRCLVRPVDFRFNLLRILSSQLSRHRFIPPRDHSPQNWMESVRSEDARRVAERTNHMPQLVSGAVGIGKTSLLRSFLASFATKGWTCRFISDASQLRALSDPFDCGRTLGCALAIDNGHELPQAMLESLLEKAASATAARLAVGGLPTLRRHAPQSLPDDSYYLLPLVSFSSLRAFAERLFDLSGHHLADVVLDRVAFYAAGRPALLYALVYALFLELGQRPVLSGVAISLDHVETAYGRSEFRNAAKSILLTPVETEPLANLVLATVLVVMELEISRSRDPGVELDRVKQWLETENVAISASELRDTIEYLRELELVDTDRSSLRVALSMSGGGYVLMSLLPEDRLQHFSSVKTRMIQDE